MGLSLRKIGNSIRDVFDANTASDQAKRVAQGRPAQYSGVNLASPASVVKSVAQRALPNTSFNNPGSVAFGVANKFTPMGLRDRFDANTASDQLRRAQATQTPFRVPTSYEDQQAMQGNERPFTNFGQHVIGNAARVVNTAVQQNLRTVPQAVAGVTLKVANRTGLLNNRDYNNAVNNVLSDKKVYGGYRDKGGVLNAGTVVDSPEQAKNLDGGDVVNKSVGYGLGVYGELSPIGAKGGLVGRTLLGATEGAVGDVGSQMVNTGNVNLRQTAGSAVFGGTLSNVGPAISKLVNKGSVPTPKVSAKGKVDIYALKDTNKVLYQKLESNRLKGLSDNNPSQIRLRQTIQKNEADISRISQGGYVKNPLAKDPLESLRQEARKYKSAEEFGESLNLMKWGKVTGVGELPISKLSKSQMKVLLKDGLPENGGSLKVSDFKKGRQITQPIEVSQRGSAYVVENGRHRLFQALANGDENVPVVFKGGEGKAYSTPVKDLYNQATQSQPPKSPLANDAPQGKTPFEKAVNADELTRKDVVGKQFTWKDSQGKPVRIEFTDNTGNYKLLEDANGQKKGFTSNYMSGISDDLKSGRLTPVAQVGKTVDGLGEIPPKPKVAVKTPDLPAVTGKPKRELSFMQTISPDRIIRENVTRPIEQGINKAIGKAQVSKNPILRTAGRVATGISREAGVSPELLAAKRKLQGGVEMGKVVREDIADLGKGFDTASKERVWAALDPEQAAKKGISVDPKTFTPEETQLYDQLKVKIDETTQGNLSRGLIDEKTAANGEYIKRGYSVFEAGSDHSKAYDQTKKNLLKQYTGRKDVTEELIDSAITDPTYLVAKKAAESHAAWAMVDYGNYLVKSGVVSDVAKPGYRQLPTSKLYGEASGKFVPVSISEDFTGFQYNNGVMNAINDIVTAYDNLGVRKYKKQLLTVFNPAVRGGNQVSNRAIFSNMNGINPVQFNKNYLEVGDMIKNRDPLYLEAVEQGLTGLDITQADFARRLSDGTGDVNIASKAADWIRSSYSRADDKARIAAYVTHRRRGYSPEEAASMTQRGFQDYKSVGFFYDLAAKTPVFGNAFVRFAGDAVRIAKNSAIDHPLRAASTVALWATFVNGMSVVSGESELKGDNGLEQAKNLLTGESKSEDQKTREDRFGAPKLPFSNISTAVQTPWGEVNASRFLPFYQLNETQSGIGRFLPIQQMPVGIEDGKVKLRPESFQDPLLGQVGQIAMDTDFRGKSIQDPENTGQFQSNLSKEQKIKNGLRFIATNNLPMGKETDVIASAATGNEDIYGKKRSLTQAVLRSGGVKVEQYGKEQASEQRSTNEYFDEKEFIDKQVAGLSKSEQEAYKQITGYYKLREQVPNEFKPGDTRYKKEAVFNFPEDKWGTYTSNPKLYDLQLQKKERDNQRQGTPIQPEFDERLSTDFRKQLINNKSLAPGEDVEADERLYNASEWDTYQAIKKEYEAEAKKYYPEKDGEFVDELVKHKSAKFPEKGPAKTAYDEAYKLYAEGKGEKPVYNDQVDAEKDAYNEGKRVWTNNERKARGLPPISKEMWDNVTFGYESDEEKVYKQLKYGKGYGGFGSGGGSDPSLNPLKYAVSTKSTAKGPTISLRTGGAGRRVTLKAPTGAPKVSTKKSLV